MHDAGDIKEIVIKETDKIIQKIEETFSILFEREWTLRQLSARGFTMEYDPLGLEISYLMIRR